MNYIMIHRLRKPAILLLVGVIALLVQLDVLDHFWKWFVPLLLIMLGVFMLAERAALATGEVDGYPQGPYPVQPYPAPIAGAGPASSLGSNLEGAPQAPTAGNSASAQAFGQDTVKEPEGGQS